MKKIIITLCAVMAVLTVACFASAETDGFEYQVMDDGTAQITGCSLTGHITIPSEIDGYKVTSLKSKLFFGCWDITEIDVPATVTYFGEDPTDNMWDYVFSYCYDLERINVDSGNTVFASYDGVLYTKDQSCLINYPCGKQDLYYKIPYSVDTIYCTAFASSSLSKLYISNPEAIWMTYTFYGDEDMKVYYYKGGYAEQRVDKMKSNGQTTYIAIPDVSDYKRVFNLPSKLKTIDAEAFTATSANAVVIAGKCKSIKTGAFSDCKNLKAIYIKADPKNITIESGAIPDNVEFYFI